MDGDKVFVKMVKICNRNILSPLVIIFQDCLEKGIYPSNWKHSNVCPAHKNRVKTL